MYDPLAVIGLLGLYIGLLFLIALWVERGTSWGKRLANSPIVYSLALAVYCTSWTFYGSVGNAASSGMLFLTIYLGPTLAIILWWFVLRKLVRIKATQRITSIADFVSARYGKSQGLAALASLLALVGTSPYIALQLKAVTDTFTIITTPGGVSGSWIGQNVDLVVVGLMILFTIIIGVRRLDPTERHEGVITALAVKCVVKLVAFLAVGTFVVYFMYDGFGDIFQRLSETPFNDLANTAGSDASSYITWATYLVLAMSAIMFLPRQFHIAVVENADEKHLRTAVWLFPLYLLLINVFVFPIAVGGLLQGYPDLPPDSFVLGLPLNEGQPWLGLLVFVGGFSAAAGMIIISAMTTSTMITNHLLLPLIERAEGLSFLRRHLLRARWVAVASVLLIGYGFERLIGESYTLVNMGLISFAAALQFAPVILGGLFWRRGNRAGALLGLSAGFLVWAYTLFVPSFTKSGWLPSTFIENGPWGIGFLKPEALFGLAGLPPLAHTVLWTMVFNLGLYLLGSLYFETRGEERRLAEAFVDALATGALPRPLAAGRSYIDLAGKGQMIKDLLSQYLTDVGAATVLKRCLTTVGIQDKQRISVAELAELQGEIEKSLAGAIGSAAAHRALRQVALFTDEEAQDLSEVYSDILIELKVSPEELRSRIDFYHERSALLTRQAEELEEKVSERTAELETATAELSVRSAELEKAVHQSERRAELLQAGADVSRAVAQIHDLDRLLSQVTYLISQHFGFYHAGIFLIDEAGRYAVLQAANSKGGQRMLARNHKLGVGSEGIVGYVTGTGQPRIALDVGEDAVHFKNPDLPETRSEMAVPLRAGDTIIGALDVQSTVEAAFAEEDVTTLTALADQITIAIQNARLFQQTEEALEEAEQVQRRYVQQAWAQFVKERPALAHEYTLSGVPSVDDAPLPEAEQAWLSGELVVADHAHSEETKAEHDQDGDLARAALAAPIKIRGEIIGVLDLQEIDVERTWTEDEIELIQAVADQLGQALEGARLFEETQRRAHREALTRQITERVRAAGAAGDIEAILQTTAEELGKTLGVTRAVARLSLPTTQALEKDR